MTSEPAPITLGFPRKELPPRLLPAARPTPQPHRPKGRWFISTMLIGVCALAGYNLWHSYFRYQAYGTVSGELIQVSPPWDGSLAFMHVKEGDVVRQGQLLVVMDNIELRQKHGRVCDDLRIAQAQLEAETARLKWQSAFSLDQSQGSLVLYRELLGTLLREQSNLENSRTKLRRAERIFKERAISQEELFQYRYEVQGMERNIAKITEALEELKKRSDQAGRLLKDNGNLARGLAESGNDQLKPFLARINALQAERDRLQEQLDAGQVRAPANGVIVKTQRRPGELCKTAEPILTVLREGSLEVILYAPQSETHAFKMSEEIGVLVEPYDLPLACDVARLGDQMEPAPESIKRHYAEGQRLLPVYLKPRDLPSHWMTLRVGSTAKVPR